MKRYWNLVLSLFVLAMTACVGNPGDELDPSQGDENIDHNKLVLLASSPYIANDGKDQVTFTVKKGKQDVTAQAKIYLDYDLLPSPTFSTTKLGTYKFFATYENEYTETILVEAISGLLQVPADKHPEKFDGFRRHIFALQGTSLYCAYCPMMIAALQEFAPKPTSKDMILVAAHGMIGNDPMMNAYSTRAIQAAGFPGIPAMSFNMRSSEILQAANGDTPKRLAVKIENRIKNLMSTPAKTAISAAVKGIGSSIRISAKVKVAATGKYRISAWIVEDDILQKGQSNGYGPQLGDYNLDTHSCVLRYISSSATTGDNLGGKETINAKETIDFFHEFNNNKMEVKDLSKTRVILIVTSAEGSRYTVDNVISCPMNGNVEFDYQ